MNNKKCIFTILYALCCLSVCTYSTESSSLVPKLTKVHTAASKVLVLTFETGYHTEDYENPIDIDNKELWKVNGTSPANIYLMSVPWDELEKDASGYSGYPILMQHYVYLELEYPLQNNMSYQIVTPYGEILLEFDENKTFCESIKVNQAGYNERATHRYANLDVFLGSGGGYKFNVLPDFKVIDESTGQVLCSGTVEYFNDSDIKDEISKTGFVYRIPLNELNPGGPYFITICGTGRSYPFFVGNYYSGKIAYIMTRALYHQRCGIALEKQYTKYSRAVCHTHVAHTGTPFSNDPVIEVSDNAEMFPAIGGYHDAGDFDRRHYHTSIPIMMLSYFEAFPKHFIDNQYNIPESGNGIPDFLDEALWGLLIWENLQITDPGDPEYGGVMAGTERSGHPVYGDVSAASEDNKYGTWEVLLDVTADSAGMFAHASRLLKTYDQQKASELLKKAENAWEYIERNYDFLKPKSCIMYAALQLYLATFDLNNTEISSKYHNVFKDMAYSIFYSGEWPEQFVPGNTSANCHTYYFISYLISSIAKDETLVNYITQKIIGAADSGHYMGIHPKNYPYPQGATKFYGWGAGTAQGRYADIYCFAYRLTNDIQKKEDYLNAVSLYADYSLGLNPLGKSFVTGLGENQVNSPLHLDSYYTKYGKSDGVSNEHLGNPIGNIPGITIYGPSLGRLNNEYNKIVSDKLYPEWESLPPQRRWADGWSLVFNNEFSVHETIVWNICMHAFLYSAENDKGPIMSIEVDDNTTAEKEETLFEDNFNREDGTIVDDGEDNKWIGRDSNTEVSAVVDNSQCRLKGWQWIKTHDTFMNDNFNTLICYVTLKGEKSTAMFIQDRGGLFGVEVKFDSANHTLEASSNNLGYTPQKNTAICKLPENYKSIPVIISVKGNQTKVAYRLGDVYKDVLIVNNNNRFDDSNFYLKLGYHGIYDDIIIKRTSTVSVDS